jgi:ribosome-associated heat shock protein Hsp15
VDPGHSLREFRGDDNPLMTDTVRIDKWLWAARFFRTRGLAREAINGGKVELDGHRVKPGRILKSGDRLSIRRGDDQFEVTVTDLDERRVSAALAQEKYVEDPESAARREAAAEQRKLERQARVDRPRRPDKRQRRQIRKFTGRE